jgi:release factor glutamine methyltransferase
VPTLARELSFEPRLALDGGSAGLAVIDRLVRGAAARLAPGGLLAVEMHESHAEVLPALCAEAGLVGAEVRRDLAGLPRLALARAP